MSVVVDIHVPTLIEGEKTVVPQFWLGKDVEYWTDRKSNAFSAAEYNSQMTLPTLAELRHAFFGGSEDYRQSVLAKRGYGEWTSTFLSGRDIIDRPENVAYRNGVWIIEGGKTNRLESPYEGWVLEFDKQTGFPSRTSVDRKDAEKVFGGNISYFTNPYDQVEYGRVRVVSRLFNILGNVPFFISTDSAPDHAISCIGGRACRRSE